MNDAAAVIAIACITDGDYLRHTAAMLHSVLAHSAPARVHAHVLHEAAIAPAEQRKLEQMLQAAGGTVSWLPIGEAGARPFPGGHFPRSVWFRVLLPELLPALDRVLYLDSDLIATGSLLPLWQTALGGQLLGAVTNPLYPFMPPYPAQQLGIARAADYFNSGVLLLDLAQMRREDTAQKLIECARQRPGLWYPDQDALNLVCRDRWLALHPRWNAQSTYFELDEHELPVPAAQVREARTQPAIVHFIGALKPWTYLCRHPLRHLYLEHARATPWGEVPLTGRTLRTILLRPLPFYWIDRWFALERWLERKRQGLGRRLRAAGLPV